MPSMIGADGGFSMTIAAIVNKLRTVGSLPRRPLLQWLYSRVPPQMITSRRTYQAILSTVKILVVELEMDTLSATNRRDAREYLRAAYPLIEEYEKEHFHIGEPTPEEMLEFLMDQHSLTQRDLAGDLGGQSVVSDLLRGKRKLNRRQIERLAKRFNVAPSLFWGSSPPGASAATFNRI